MPTLFTQENPNTLLFHRLLIFNEANELMIVKFKDRDFWVTPGLYAADKTQPKEKLKTLALSDYGLTISDLKLKGMFLLTVRSTNKTLFRYTYIAKSKSNHIKMPDMIETVEWLTPAEAVQKITFPHIRLMINQLLSNPNQISAGTIERYSENGEFKATVTEALYTLDTTD